jgi:lactate permease
VLPAILVAGVTLAVSQLLVATLAGPWMTGVVSGLATMAALVLFLRAWKPRTTWTPPSASPQPAAGKVRPGAALRAWAPFLLMSVMVLLWGTAPVKELLAPLGLSIRWPLLDGAVLRAPPVAASVQPYPAVLGFSILSAPGTAIFLAGLLSVPLLPGLGIRRALACFGRTVKTLRYTILTVCLVLATAHVMNYSGMSATLGLALAGTGALFPVFSPLLGWFGVLLTGSDTSSNALFCSLQRATAERLGIDPVLAVAANTSGGVAGKMVSPQSLSVAAASAGLPGGEGRLLRRVIVHSVAMALVVSAIVFLQATVLRGIP